MLTHLQMAISLMPPCSFYLHTSPGLLTLRSHSYLTKTSLRYADQSAMLRFFGNLIPLKVVMIAHKICVNCLRQLCDPRCGHCETTCPEPLSARCTNWDTCGVPLRCIEFISRKTLNGFDRHQARQSQSPKCRTTVSLKAFLG